MVRDGWLEQEFGALRPYLVDEEPDASGERRALCPLHDDSSPSASFNFDKGVWRCFAGCPDGPIGELLYRLEEGEGIDTEVVIEGDTGKFTTDRATLAKQRANGHRNRPPEPLSSLATIKGWHAALMADTDDSLSALETRRGLSSTTAEDYMLGWDRDAQAYVLPMYDGDQLVNVKRYRLDPTDGQPKMWSVRGHGQARLYPGPPTEDEVVLAEGELDCLTLREHGFHAVTGTGGAGVWTDEWTEHFTDRKVFIAYDGDAAGRDGAKEVAAALEGVAAEVVVLDLKDGKDITDLALEAGDEFAEGLRAALDDEGDRAFEREVRHRTRKLHIYDEADRRHRLRQAREQGMAPPEDPPAADATDWFAQNIPDPDWLVEGLVEFGWNVCVAGPAKVGKTTLVLDLLRCLTTASGKWLREFPLHFNEGRVAWLNLEMSERNLRRWMVERGAAPDRLAEPMSLRSGGFSVHDETWMDHLRSWLRATDASVLVVDSLTELVVASGMDEHTEVLPVLKAMDRLREDTPLTTILYIGHFGHAAERLRGDSRALGRFDATLKMVEKGGAKFLSATGRYDIGGGLPESELSLGPDGEFIVQPGQGRDESAAALDQAAAELRQSMQQKEVKGAVLNVITAEEGLGAKELRDRVRAAVDGVSNGRVDEAVAELVAEEAVEIRTEANNKKAHYLGQEEWE